MSISICSNFLEPQSSIVQLNTDFQLESGESITDPIFAYQTWGVLAEDQSNVVWICHALTGNHSVHQWWEGTVGENLPFDPAEKFIVCVNILGSCYGSTGPLSKSSSDGNEYFTNFPMLTIRDLVAGLIKVRLKLNIHKIHALIGASLGGQIALEWAIIEKNRIENLILIACNAKHSAYGIAWNESQRLCIAADPSFYENKPTGGQKGLLAARSVAMLSYRSYQSYQQTQIDNFPNLNTEFKAASYQKYQGEKFIKRFNAYSYWTLSKAMDSHNIARGRSDIQQVLKQLSMPVLVIGIDSDLLFPLEEQLFLAQYIPNSTFCQIQSIYGHDAFLIEYNQLNAIIADFQHKINTQIANTIQ